MLVVYVVGGAVMVVMNVMMRRSVSGRVSEDCWGGEGGNGWNIILPLKNYSGLLVGLV